jgi:hypothetical protein
MTEFRDGSFYFHLNGEKQINVGHGGLGVEGITRDRKKFSFNIPINNLESQKNDLDSMKFVGQGSNVDSGLDWRVEFIMPADRLMVRWKYFDLQQFLHTGFHSQNHPHGSIGFHEAKPLPESTGN